MMVKIGNSYFAETAIEAIVPEWLTGRSPDRVVRHNSYDVHLANGNILTVEATEDEVTAAVSLLGFCVPEELEEPQIEFSRDELEELASLFEAGFRWAARDRDGKAFTYKDKPEKGNTSWKGDEFQRLHHDFEAIVFEADAPLDLAKLFTGVLG